MWAALQKIAAQNLSSESDVDDLIDADWQAGYDALVAMAREAIATAPTDSATDALNVLLERCDTSDSRNYGTLSTGLVRHIAKQGLSGGDVRSDPDFTGSGWDDSWDDQPLYFNNPEAADKNAPWLTDAHALCSDMGIPPGRMVRRIAALRLKIEQDADAKRLDFIGDAGFDGNGTMAHIGDKTYDGENVRDLIDQAMRDADARGKS